MKQFFRFSSRITRTQFWLSFFLAGAAMGIARGLFAALIYISTRDGLADPQMIAITIILNTIIAIIVLIALLSMFVRRLHDRNRSGGWILLYLAAPLVTFFSSNDIAGLWDMPIIGQAGTLISISFLVLVLADLGFAKGSSGANRFGPDPITGASEPTDVFS